MPVNAAQMIRGNAGVGADKRNPPPRGDAEAEATMRSAAPPFADPKSPHYDGSRCFRSRNPGLGLLLESELAVQVGGKLLPPKYTNLRFQAVGGDYGELLVMKDDPRFDDIVARIVGDPTATPKIKPHRWFLDGTIVDAVVAHAEVKKATAQAAIAALSDPEVRAEVEAELGVEVVSTFLAAATEVKPVKLTGRRTKSN